MNTGATNPKQLWALGVLGMILLVSIAHGVLQIITPTPAPVGPGHKDGATSITPAVSQPAAPAPAAAPAGSPSGTPAAGTTPAAPGLDSTIVPLPPDQLRNPFQRQGGAGAVPSSSQPPIQPGQAPHPAQPAQPPTTPMPPLPPAGKGVGAAGEDVRHLMAEQNRGTSTQRSTFSSPTSVGHFDLASGHVQPPTGTASRGSSSQPMPGSQHGTPGEGTGSTTPPAKPAAPLDPLAEFVADTEQLKAAVVVRGVIVGSPSTAFVTINGQEQVLHVGDALLDDFRIISISDTGIVADYTRRQALHKSAFLRL